MDQDTWIFYGNDETSQNDSILPAEDMGYEDDYSGYEVYEEPYPESVEEISENYDYEEAYFNNGEENTRKRFRTAMSVFDLVSILAGVVMILGLTMLVISMISWFQTDIVHSFVLLQSRIQ